MSICAKKGIRNVVLSPGSRCAPLTLAFVRHPDIQTKTITDERSAAFVAMGMAQQLEKPVVLVCTSGSAALNYFPAVAEAFFQQIPLVVITADRPPEWIDQWDGQTIRQNNVYGEHVKGSFQFPDEFGHPDKVWHAQRMVNEAINLSTSFPAGPVHINIPLREPFYPEKGEIFDFSSNINLIEAISVLPTLSEETQAKLRSKLNKFSKILIVPGQQRPNVQIQKLLDELVESHKAIVVTDTLSNLQSEQTINCHDHFLGLDKWNEALDPDLIVSFGKSLISKNLKLFLRKSKAAHWHIQPGGYVPDTYQSLSFHIPTTPCHFFEFLKENIPSGNPEFRTAWQQMDQLVQNNLSKIIDEAPFGEYKAIQKCLQEIPDNTKIHVANSMAVRYVNLLGMREQEIICNRGTSGIDGTNSTAVGCTFTTKDQVTLITGDVAFFYDRNAFWHNYTMPNLRIILLNNHAGGIFRLIEGPANQPELEEYFETEQVLSANHLAAEYGFEYINCTNESQLEFALQSFHKKSIHPKILEIHSESVSNAEILKWVKGKVSRMINSN
nr:2-succinyl-5-enolpyruvyl-6-hydroxy-3-cyclohexene-1-carboxylic-acid synthase [Rhodonellum psychrophilum]